MAMTSGDDDVVARAARELRAESESGWVDITDTIVSAVRSATRRSWPVRADVSDLDTDDPTSHPDASRDGASDTVYVSDQVVIAVLRSALTGLHDAAPERIDLFLDGNRCTGAHLGIVAAYGTDLAVLADQARAIAAEVLADLLGPDAGRARDDTIDVTVTDVTETDPRL